MKPSTASQKPVTSGQKEECIRLILDAVRKAAGVAIDELIKNGVLDGDSIERVRQRGNEVVAAITPVVKQKFADLADNILGCVKLISGAETLELDPTDGTETIAQAIYLFAGGLSADFKRYGTDVAGTSTPKAKVSVYEMFKNGDFAKIFGSFGDNLDALRLEQDQIIQFVKKYRRWLHTDGYSTFFLFKVASEFFVASVILDSCGHPRVEVDRFGSDGVWFAEVRRRVVVPQLAL